MRITVAFLALLLAILWAPASLQAAAPEFILGDVEDIAALDECTAQSEPLWQITTGANVLHRMTHGYHIPAMRDSLLKLQAWRRDPAGKEPSRNWYTIGRALTPDEGWTGAEGIRIVLASEKSGSRWLSISLVTKDGASYAQVFQPNLAAMQFIELALPFDAFRDKTGQHVDPAQVARLTINGASTPEEENALYLDRVSLYRRPKYTAWVDFRTSAEGNNLFERGQAVAATFQVGGRLPEGARGFAYEVRDYFGAIAQEGNVPLTGSDHAIACEWKGLRPGFYAVRAYWTGASGKRLSDASCIRAEGSMPTGLGTFAVMPSTLAENRARFQELSTNAYLGMHGDTAGLADAVGLTWRFEYRKWKWLEPQKPDRSAGRAKWATDTIANTPPYPASRPHILNMRVNLMNGDDAPAWTLDSEKPTRAPFFRDWEDFLAHFRDYIAVEKHLYPHMKPRIYDVLWEVDLNMPPASVQKPPYTYADVVEACWRAKEVLRVEDPDGILIGPNHSSLFGGEESLAWHEELFKAGLLQHIDALSCHGYHRPLPEDRDIPGTMKRLDALVRRYNGGRSLPLYCTEMGYTDSVGSTRDYHRQAQMMVRFAIIFRGEGGRVFLPFYGSDYGRGSEYGFLFNLEMEKRPWGAKRFAPKPVVPAMGALVRMIEGATPVRRVERLGEGVWAYLFDRKGTRVLAVWHPSERRAVRIPVGSAKGIAVFDFMGNPRKAEVRDGTLVINVDASPVYVTGLAPNAPL